MKNTITSDEDLLGVCYLFILEKMRQRRHQQNMNRGVDEDADKPITGNLSKDAGLGSGYERDDAIQSFQSH